jgi:formylglycine-generating enzyme required for sulfatase activity
VVIRRVILILVFVPFLSNGLKGQDGSLTTIPSSPWKVYDAWPFSAGEAKRRQEETARDLGAPIERKLDLGNGVAMELVLIPAGRFVMGTAEPVEPDWEKLDGAIQKGKAILGLGGILILVFLFPVLWDSLRKRIWPRASLGRFILLFLALSVTIIGVTTWWIEDQTRTLAKAEFEAVKARFAHAGNSETPTHPVIITRPFYIGKYEVTQEEWKQVMNNNPSFFIGLRRPVERVSWQDAQAFCGKVKENTKLDIRLPSEAEWEYACRAGMETIFHNGDEEKRIGMIAWYYENSGGQTHPVGEKEANSFGLFDMPGNVWEWLGEHGHESFPDVRSDGLPWTGQESAHWCVVRGGSWGYGSNVARCACRDNGSSDYRFNGTGFRV